MSACRRCAPWCSTPPACGGPPSGRRGGGGGRRWPGSACRYPGTWHAAIGGPGTDAAMLTYLADLLGHADAAALRERWWIRHLALVDAAPLRPGVAGYLAEAVRLGLGLAVASSATGDWVAAHLRRLGTREAFTVVATGDAHAPKPAPDTYLGALAGLGVPAAEAVAFRDSPARVR